MKRKIFYVIFTVLVIVFIVSSVGLGTTLYSYQHADKIYNDLQNNYVDEPTDDEQKESAPISVDFDTLMKENSDIIGWLYCENTVINYPVVQTSDNDYYLRRDLHGEYLRTGTLFADYRCAAVGTAQNHIIYGHNMKNSAMFGTLINYSEQEYYDAHPVLYYLTPDKDYRIDLFAGFTTDAGADIYRTEFESIEKFEEFLQEIKAKSSFESGVAVTGDDNIVMLSTCSYEFNDARYVVFGKLTSL